VNAPAPVVTADGLAGRLYRFLTSRYLLSVGAQAFVSGFHFALNLILLRLVTPYDYGVFAFAFVLAISASAVNNALVATPLTVYTPVIADPDRRRAQEGMFASANLVLVVALLVAGVAWALADGQLADGTGIGIALFVAAYTARQYSRNVSYARLRPLVVAASDIAYAVAGFALLAALYVWRDTLPVAEVLVAVALANLVAMALERVLLNRGDPGARRRRFASLAGYGRIWRESAAWALVGALTTMFLGQAHSFIVTATHGPGAFAPLAAGFVLFGPVRVALLTWQNMVKPELAVDLAAGRIEAVRRRIRTTVWRMVAAVAALGIALMLAWPWIHEFLYARRYADEPMGAIVAAWCLVTVAAASYNAPSAALQASTEFRTLAFASIWGALVSGVLVGVTLALFEPSVTLVGILAAETFVALWLARALHRVLASRETLAEAAPAGSLATDARAREAAS